MLSGLLEELQVAFTVPHVHAGSCWALLRMGAQGSQAAAGDCKDSSSLQR